MTDGSALCRLAERMGILPAYHDFGGSERFTSDATRRALLSAMGRPVETERDAEDHLADLEAADRARIAPAKQIVAAGAPARIDLKRPASWALTLEGESEVAEEGVPADRIDTPPLPEGESRRAACRRDFRGAHCPRRGWNRRSLPSFGFGRRAW